MKWTIWMCESLTSVAIVLAATAAYAGLFTTRQVRQQARIHQGVEGGALTPGETKVLQHEQRGIERLRQRAVADGHIGPRERETLVDAQDDASRDIYRLKHNAREVPPVE